MSWHVMVPLDGSAFAEQAIPYAVDLVKHVRGVLHLVKVHVPPEEPALGDAMYVCSEALDEEIREEERTYLAQVAANYYVSEREPITAVLGGDVVGGLSEYVRSCSIDLIVMSTHGRSGLSRAWLGSVAEALLRATHVPALLLRPVGDQFGTPSLPAAIRKILIPVDGSTFSEAVIQTATAVGGQLETSYTLLQVVIPPIIVGLPEGVVVGPPEPALLEELKNQAEAHLNSIADRLRVHGYSVETTVVVDPDPAEAIGAYVADRGFDLIAMATHGRTGWKRVVLGSVSDRVKRGAAVPVLMVQPAAQNPPVATVR